MSLSFLPPTAANISNHMPLRGTVRKPIYHPANLAQGDQIISAYPDDDINEENFYLMEMPVRVDSDLPETGPLASEVTPIPLPGKELAVPTIHVACNRTSPPGVSFYSSYASAYNFDEMNYDLNIEWCKGDADKARIRLIEWKKDETGIVKTTVLSQTVAEYLQYQTTMLEARGCADRYIYAEACVSKPSKGMANLLCGTSRFKLVPKRIVPEPRLKWRPPIKVMLAPGDAFEWKVQTWLPPDRPDDIPPFSNDLDDTTKMKYGLQGVVEKHDGNITTSSKIVSTSVVMSLNEGATGVSLKENGTIIYANYSSATCMTSEGTWRDRYKTTILVSSKYKSLVRQDVSLPTIETPVYHETVFQAPARITVNASNPGLGLRSDGASTGLHYQWYLRKTAYHPSQRSYSEMIPGATEATLRIEKANCNPSGDCGRWGCSDLYKYYVDVCNTYGCRRSEAVEPRVLPPVKIPAGKEWVDALCSLQKEWHGAKR